MPAMKTLTNLILWSGATLLWAALLVSASRPNGWHVGTSDVMPVLSLLCVVTYAAYAVLKTRERGFAISVLLAGISVAAIAFGGPLLVHFCGRLLI